MSRRLVVFLVLAFVLVFGMQAGPAAAFHDGDDDSLLMSPVFQSPNATGAINSDLAFWGDRAYAGNYDGFRIFDISDPANPVLLEDFPCHGPQNDPIVWQNRLLFMAVDRTQTGPECGSTDTVHHDDPQGWEGVRIFDVSDPSNPQFIKGVYTDCGAHTISLYPQSETQLMIYVSSYPLRPGPTCGPVRGPEAGESPLWEKISVIRVPVENPGAAEVVAEPRISYPGDPDNKFDPDEHALPGFNDLTGCHDIGVFVELRLAAAACAEQVQLWRIHSDGLPGTNRPVWVFDDNSDTDGAGRYGDVAVDFWHTARFTWDGRYVQADDESFGLGCPPTTPNFMNTGQAADTGRPHMINTANGARTSHFTPTRPPESVLDPHGNEIAYCSMHQGNHVRTADRYLSVNAWYMWGVNVIDWTDPFAPQEIAFYDAAPAGAAGSDNWAHYWYEGPSLQEPSLTTYATDGVHHPATGKGFQVFRTDIAANEDKLGFLNPQTQMSTIGHRLTGVRRASARRFRSAARGKGSGLSRAERRRTARRLAP